eukprot:6492649-Amphidinium_carterae.5
MRPHYQQLRDASCADTHNTASAGPITQIDIGDTWHVGSIPFRSFFIAQGPELWLQACSSPQRTIPKSCDHLVQSHLAWLYECSQSQLLAPEQREVSLLYFLLAPRLLWPSPPRGEKLKLQTRPSIVKERCAMLREGQWDELLDAMSEAEQFRKCGSKDSLPAVPGLITKATAKRIQNAAENGRVGAAWRQLWSYGIAPSSEQTVAANHASHARQVEDAATDHRTLAPLRTMLSLRSRVHVLPRWTGSTKKWYGARCDGVVH